MHLQHYVSLLGLLCGLEMAKPEKQERYYYYCYCNTGCLVTKHLSKPPDVALSDLLICSPGVRGRTRELTVFRGHRRKA